MSRPEVERARALLERADADLAAVRALETVDTVSDEIVGFHGEQVAEKLLKAVLAGHGIEPPDELHTVTELYPFGVQLRYGSPLDDQLLDRTALRELLEHLRKWAVSEIPAT